MALLFADGFEHVNNTYSGLTKWDSSAAIDNIRYADGFSRDGGWGIYFRWSGVALSKSFVNTQTIITGLAYYMTENFGYYFVRIADSSTTQIQIKALDDGTIGVYRNTTLLGYSTPGVFSVGEWRYIELKVLVSTTVGTVELRVDGVTVLSLTGQNTSASGNDYCNSVNLDATVYNSSPRVDDFYICDTTGTENNDFLGDITITTLYPTSDGNSSDFTPSTGVDNYAVVDDPQLVNGDTYVESNTSGAKDTYGMTTFTGTGDIIATQVVATAKTVQSNALSVIPVVRSGAVPADVDGNATSLSQTIKAATHIFEKEPTDDVAWDATKINAAEFGMRLQL